MEDHIEAEGAAAPNGETRKEERLAIEAVLARNLRAHRVRRWMSQKDLVERTGMPASRIAAMEAGRGNASLDEMAKLAAVLETPLWKLLKP